MAKREKRATEKFLNLSLSQKRLIPKNAKPINIGKTLIILLMTIGNDLANVLEINEYEYVVCKYFIKQNQVSIHPSPKTKFATDKVI
jgi:hypothetical protein